MTVAIRIAGVDIVDDVLLARSFFKMAVGPSPGDFELKVRDDDKTYAFRAGESCSVDVDGERCFEGYVLYATHGYAFAVDDTTDPDTVSKIWTLSGSDINILFQKRVIFDQSDPKAQISVQFPAGTSDLVWLAAIMDNLTIAGDNLTTSFQHVGTPNPDRDSIAVSIGDSWGRVMQLTSDLPGAVWGIRPTRQVYYEDDDTVTAPFALSDAPNNTTSFGYSNLEWTEDGTKLVNDAQIWGVGLGLDHLSYKRVIDDESVALHGRWENGNGWRFDLWRQASVDAVASSIVYGSPQHLHGGKDDSKHVTCTIRKPGLIPGDKVRIVSTVFGEDVVLPVRQMKTRFNGAKEPLFDLDLSWEIDAARNFYDGPLPLPPEPPGRPTKPNPCDNLLLGSGSISPSDAAAGIDGNWVTTYSDQRAGPVLGYFSAGSATGEMTDFLRYFQNFFLVEDTDGWKHTGTFIRGTLTIDQPANWYFTMRFAAPTFAVPEVVHEPPIGTDIEFYNQASPILTVNVFGHALTLLEVETFQVPQNEVKILGHDGTWAQGTQWLFEITATGHYRVWAAGAARPVDPTGVASGGLRHASSSIFVTMSLGSVWGGGAVSQSETEWASFYSGTDTPAYGAGSGAPFYAGPIITGTTANFGEMNFSLVAMSNGTDLPPECVEDPGSGPWTSETAIYVSPGVYTVRYAFAAGSTSVFVDGTRQRIGIDYVETAPSTITFLNPLPESADVFVYYATFDPSAGGSASPISTTSSITFRPQIGDPTTTLDRTVCLLESAAMVLEWHTHGGISVWGGQLVPWCGKSEDEIRATGTDLYNAALAWRHYDQTLDIRIGNTWSDLWSQLTQGKAVILVILYGFLRDNCEPSFAGTHAVAVLPRSDGVSVLVGDPLCGNFRYMPIADVRKAAEAAGNFFFGTSTPQRLYFGVSQPWV